VRRVSAPAASAQRKGAAGAKLDRLGVLERAGSIISKGRSMVAKESPESSPRRVRSTEVGPNLLGNSSASEARWSRRRPQVRTSKFREV